MRNAVTLVWGSLRLVPITYKPVTSLAGNNLLAHYSHMATIKHHMNYPISYFFYQATIYFAARFVQLLFEGGVYFLGRPGDINDGWIRYKRIRR